MGGWRRGDALLVPGGIEHLDGLVDALVGAELVAADSDSHRVVEECRSEATDGLGPCCRDWARKQSHNAARIKHANATHT